MKMILTACGPSITLTMSLTCTEFYGKHDKQLPFHIGRFTRKEGQREKHLNWVTKERTIYLFWIQGHSILVLSSPTYSLMFDLNDLKVKKPKHVSHQVARPCPTRRFMWSIQQDYSFDCDKSKTKELFCPPQQILSGHFCNGFTLNFKGSPSAIVLRWKWVLP